MGEETKKDPKPVSMINPYKLWKMMYFSTEDALTAAVRKSVTTGEFANGIDLILNSYLQYLKMHNEFMARYMEDSPFSSKRDVARVAELVVSLENKLDSLEGQFEEKLAEIEDSAALISQKMSTQQAAAASQELSDLLNPALTAINDLGKRLSDLEKLIKKLDSDLSGISNPQKAEAKKTMEKPTLPKTPKAGSTLKELMAKRDNPPAPKVQKPKSTDLSNE